MQVKHARQVESVKSVSRQYLYISPLASFDPSMLLANRLSVCVYL